MYITLLCAHCRKVNRNSVTNEHFMPVLKLLKLGLYPWFCFFCEKLQPAPEGCRWGERYEHAERPCDTERRIC